MIASGRIRQDNLFISHMILPDLAARDHNYL
jgi:hypothetical protein